MNIPLLDERHLDALETLSTSFRDNSITWSLTGSTSFALQGVPLLPNDIDVQTTEEGAYEIEEQSSEQFVVLVSFSVSESIQSHLGMLQTNNVRIEVMGAVQKRHDNGTWESPIDITDHRVFVDVEGIRLPVLSLEYEAKAYEQLGRPERAALLSALA